ncbi:winged helix-turn-helix domain-containing protein [Natronorubrum halophilum]|uniref:winged helix-turn-helix domain-containing protein n=1 Tax=Natronorubrum halophilum TaxID=1702106 RepID=UPI001EE8559A|nr:helix-turn-helix domain-containing protein [Natronorubrum halophilum]
MESEPSTNVNTREAFSLLGHDIRLDILLALLEDWVAVYTEPKSYSELMAAVEMEDSGKFNYHLNELRGVYIRKVEDGYVPTASATALYRTVLAHRPTEAFEFEPRSLEAACPDCGSPLVLRYDRGFVSIDCDACEEWIGFTYSFPQNGFASHGSDAVLDAIDNQVRCDIEVAGRGQCPDCVGSMTVDLRIDAIERGDHRVELACNTCSFIVGTDLLSAMVGDDRVASALRSVGINPEQRLWNSLWARRGSSRKTRRCSPSISRPTREPHSSWLTRR